MMTVTKIQVLSDARLFVSYWYGENGAKQTKGNILPTLILDYDRMVKAYAAEAGTGGSVRGKLTPKLLEYALEEYVADQAAQAKTVAIATVQGTGSNLVLLCKWVRAVTGDETSTDIAAIAHWCWMVKREAKGLPVVHHIMPVLFGPQGSGKTMALHKLIKPLEAVRAEFPMNNLSNPSYYSAFDDNLIVLFDELQGIDKTDLTHLKHQITASHNSYRKLYTHTVVTVPMSCSFIGATNKHLYESVSDVTGMRRFYELRTQPMTDWTTVNAIDYVQLWKGIDDTLDRGYLIGDTLAAVHKYQESSKDEEEIDIYIRERKLHIAPDAQGKDVSKQDLYTDYSIWAANNGIRYKLSSQWFTKKLKNRGILTREDDKAGRMFAISVESCIGGLK